MSQTVDESGTASFTVVAAGSGNLSYQWFDNGNPISGAVNPTLTFSNVQPSENGSYTVVVANTVNTVTSDPATLTVLAVPVISGLATSYKGYLEIPFQLVLSISNSPSTVVVTGLPPGLAYDSATGAISGTPTAIGPFMVAVTAANGLGAGIPGAFTLTIAQTPLAFNAFAGGQKGSLDGGGTAAQFNSPSGLAMDSQGDLYIADTGNATIRKVTASGAVTTIAGTAGQTGSTDGQGSAARFSSPTGIAVDGTGDLYVTDTGNNTLRKITASGATTTIAGTAGVVGSTDSTGSGASFNGPTGIAVDSAGNLYVSDSGNDTVRKITAGGTVTTLAGLALQSGYVDAFGIGARFKNPSGIAVDASGNIYVNDGGNVAMREITPAGSVSTLAKLPDADIFVNGNPNATFNGVTVDGSGNIYAAAGPLTHYSGIGIGSIDSNLVEISTGGATNILQTWDEPMTNLKSIPAPKIVTGVARASDGTLYILVDGVLEKSSLASGPTITVQPQDQSATSGQTVTFSVTATSNPPPTYQWQLNGADIAGATSSTLTLSDVSADQAGSYSVTISTPFDSVSTIVGTLSVTGLSARLVNISTRAQVGTGGNILIPGFTISGSGTETLLIRADGPGLTQFAVAGVLAKPSLSVFDHTGAVIATNTGWSTNPDPALIASTSSSVGAFALQAGSADCALIVTLPAGSYTAQVSGVGNTTGVALAEVYEVSTTGTRLTNISTRAQVGTGSNILIPGFVISGGGTEPLLVRADGPGLAQFGVAGVLTQPSLSTFDHTGTVVESNTAWGTNPDPAAIASAAASAGAFAFAPGSADSAEAVNLTEGAYTIQISGVNNSTGVALAEIYELP